MQQETLDILSAKPNQHHLLTANGSSVQMTQVGRLSLPKNQEASLHESTERVSVNPFNTVPTAGLNSGGTAYVDFQLPASLGKAQKMIVNMTVTNPSSTMAHVWDLPPMPFMMKRIQVYQNGAQVGLDILPQALWKYYAYTNNINENVQLMQTTCIDSNTFRLQAGQNLPISSNRVYQIDIAPVLPFIQAQISLTYLQQVTLRIYIEDLSVLCPTNTNSTNGALQLTNCTLMVVSHSVSLGGERGIRQDYSKGNVSGRAWEYKEEVNASFQASSGAYVPFNTTAFKNDAVVYSECMLGNSTATGANLLTYYPANNIYWTTADTKSLLNGLQPSGHDLINLFYPDAFGDNVFTLAPTTYIYPAIIGSTAVKKALKTSQQLGFKVIPDRAVVQINAASTASRRLVIGAYIPRIVRVDKAGQLHVN